MGLSCLRGLREMLIVLPSSRGICLMRMKSGPSPTALTVTCSTRRMRAQKLVASMRVVRKVARNSGCMLQWWAT